jgi:hypothetical protein
MTDVGSSFRVGWLSSWVNNSCFDWVAINIEVRISNRLICPMTHYIATSPVYSCTCTRFTGRPKPSSPYNPPGVGAKPGEVRLPRTNYCKHILAVMRTKGELVGFIPPAPPTMPLNHPIGNIEPHELSTYSRSYEAGNGLPPADKKNNLWPESMMKKKTERP